jgi:hypothetical protein
MYLLTKVILVDYRQDNVKTLYGFQKFNLTGEEKKKKVKADAINFDIACSMVEQHTEDLFICKSFTENEVEYIIEAESNRLCSCSCPDSSKICKHMLLVNRIAKIPLTLRLSLTSSAAPPLPSEDLNNTTD